MPVPAPDEAEKLFLRRVRTRRIEMGLSQGDLAQRANALGVPLYQQTVAKLESGHRSLKFAEAEALARALETTVPELYSSEDIKEREAFRKAPETTDQLRASVDSLNLAIAHMARETYEAVQRENEAKEAAEQAQQKVAAASMARRQREEREMYARTQLHLTQTRLRHLEAAHESIGHALRSRRHELLLGIQEVAAATRIRSDVIEAIEAEDFSFARKSKAAPDVYARGAIGVLAEYLGLDGEALVDLYDREHSSKG